MLFSFGNILIFLIVGLGFVFASLMIGYLVRPKVPTPEKLTTYECGEIPTENAWFNFNIRFYIMALLFIIFDVEIAFMFPVGVVFRQWIKDGSGVLALAEIGIFVLILILGLVYTWVKGDLEWVKKFAIEDKSRGTEIVPKASKVP
jgi:NADH-quinone oxidoreductase subunit A